MSFELLDESTNGPRAIMNLPIAHVESKDNHEEDYPTLKGIAPGTLSNMVRNSYEIMRSFALLGLADAIEKTNRKRGVILSPEEAENQADQLLEIRHWRAKVEGRCEEIVRASGGAHLEIPCNEIREEFNRLFLEEQKNDDMPRDSMPEVA